MTDGTSTSGASGGGSGEQPDIVTRIVDALADLLQLATDWVRQEAEAVVREKIVAPIQQLGLTLAAAVAAAALLVVALIFMAVAAVIALGDLIGYAWTFFLIGAVYLAGSAAFLVVKVRSIQK
jgi:hypothetical protein